MSTGENDDLTPDELDLASDDPTEATGNFPDAQEDYSDEEDDQ